MNGYARWKGKCTLAERWGQLVNEFIMKRNEERGFVVSSSVENQCCRCHCDVHVGRLVLLVKNDWYVDCHRIR